jgi:hypothetical protein
MFIFLIFNLQLVDSIIMHIMLIILVKLMCGDFQGLLDPKSMAQLALGEALTNLLWVKARTLSLLAMIKT